MIINKNQYIKIWLSQKRFIKKFDNDSYYILIVNNKETFHRKIGPAIISPTNEEWFTNDIPYRKNGASIVYTFINGDHDYIWSFLENYLEEEEYWNK